MSTNLLSSLSATQLRQAAAIREKIDALEKRLDGLLGGRASSVGAGAAPKTTTAPVAKKRTMSLAARARIGAAQKRRWARIKAAKKNA